MSSLKSTNYQTLQQEDNQDTNFIVEQIHDNKDVLEQQLDHIDQQKQQKPVIDVILSLQNGEFNPILICLANKVIDIDMLDSQGYGIIHHAASYDHINIIKILVQEHKADLNMKSKNGQTILMIASNYGHLDIIQYLIKMKVDIHHIDSCKFSALFFAAKENYIPSFVYLLAKGANPNIKDSLGCTLSHWCAYRNNVFLLRLLQSISDSLEYNHFFEEDQNGYIPIQRALFSESYDAVKYYVGEFKKMQKLEQMFSYIKKDINNVKNQSLKQYLQETYLIHSRTMGWVYFKHLISQAQQRNPDRFIFIVYSIFIALSLFIFGKLNIKQQKIYDDYGQYFETNVILNCLMIYLSILVIFLAKYCKFNNILQVFANDRHQNIMSTEIEGFGNIDQLELTEYQRLNKLLKIENTKTTFLHVICYLMDHKRFSELEDTDFENRYCPSCLKYKPPKTKHYGNECVNGFHFYSCLFGKVINYSNHYVYVSILIIQQIILLIVYNCIFNFYWHDLEAWTVLFPVEMAIQTYYDLGMLGLFCYLFNGFCLLYNSLFLLIELHGIIVFQTLNETINRHRYRYLYEFYQDKNRNNLMKYANCTSYGPYRNIKYYLKTAFQNLVN